MSVTTLLTDEEFTRALQVEDELGLVIRAHIHIEAKLLELLSNLANLKILEKMNLDYFQYVQLAVALGFKEEHSKALIALGTLRNQFAHKLGSTLTENRVNNLYQSLSPNDKSIVQDCYAKTEKDLKQYSGTKFQSLPPKVRFILMAVTLRSLLSVAIQEVSNRN